MKNTFSFYQGAQPGLQNFGARLMGAAGARQTAQDATLKALGAADQAAGKAALERSQAARMQAGGDALNDEAGFISNMSGLARPLAERAVNYYKSGNWGQIDPLTPNDDEGNPNAPIVLDRPTDAPLEPAQLDQVNLARKLRMATLAGKESTPEQIAKAGGEFQGQAITDKVQGDIAAGLMDRASARNQGGKLGEQIKVYNNIGSTGALYAPASGDVSVNNPLAQSSVAENLGKAQEASAKAAGAGEARVPPGYRVGPGGTLEAIPGGPADMRAGENDLRRQEREAAAADRKAKDLDTKVNHFSATLEKTGVPAFQSTLDDIKAVLTKFDGQDVPGLGATGMIPGFLLSDEGKDVRQKIATLRNIVLKDRSGAAVTDQEMRRLLEELGTGVFTTDEQFRNAVNNIEKRFNAVKSNAVAGVDDDVLRTYSERGGIPLERGQGAKPPASAPAAAAPGAPPAKAPNNRAPAPIAEGTTGKSASGKDIIFKGGKWVYAQGGV